MMNGKKNDFAANAVIVCADMLNVAQFMLTSRVVCCLYLYKFTWIDSRKLGTWQYI